jgi:recombination protein RecT
MSDIITTVEAPADLPAVRNKSDFRALANRAMEFLTVHHGMSQDRAISEMSFAVQIADRNTTIYQCTSASLYYSLANLGNLGLTLNPIQKLAYLVPRKNRGQWECNLSPSYMGLIKTCTDPGGVLVIESGIILEGDDFDISLGSGGYIRHRPLELIPRTKMTSEQREQMAARWSGDAKWGALIKNMVGAYSRAVLHNGAESIDWMPRERLEKIHRLMVKTNRDDAPAVLWPDEWCKKTVIAHHTKTLPKSDRAALAVSLLNRAEGLDLDNIPEHSDRSILSNLQDGVDGEHRCPTCEQMTVGGICRSTTCPDAIPPEGAR